MIILLMSTVLIIYKIRQRYQTTDDDEEKPHEKRANVLLLFSPANPQSDEQLIMENIVKELLRYGIYSTFFQNTSMKGCVAEWVDQNVKSCRKTFLVCNNQFAKEWVEHKPDILCGNSLVYVLRQVVDSYVVSDKRKLEKFAVLYLRKKDQGCLDYSYIGNMKSFLVDSQDETHFKQIVRFVLDQPIYTLA
jgi:hypothetical protein